MALNVIFDLCGVILEWKPDQIIDRFFKDPKIKQQVYSEIINHPDWRELDRGVLSRNEAIVRAADRTGLSIDDIEKMITYIPNALLPIPDTVKLLYSVRERGHKLFLLTNIPVFSIEYVEREYSFLACFEGSVVSCRVNMIKPEPEIYQYLMGLYNLDCGETIYIDDSDVNLNVASGLGIRTIKYENPIQCKCELENMGCL